MRLLLVSNRLWVMCRFLEEDRKEMAEMRRQQQEILNVEPGKGQVCFCCCFL